MCIRDSLYGAAFLLLPIFIGIITYAVVGILLALVEILGVLALARRKPAALPAPALEKEGKPKPVKPVGKPKEKSKLEEPKPEKPTPEQKPKPAKPDAKKELPMLKHIPKPRHLGEIRKENLHKLVKNLNEESEEDL